MDLGRLWQAWEREGGLKPRFARSRETAPEAARLGAFRLADLAGSGPGDLAFFFSLDFREDLGRARPGVLVTGEAFVAGLEQAAPPAWTEARAVIALGDPALGLALATREDAAGRSGIAHLPGSAKPAEIHPGAVVHPSAVIGAGAVLYPGVFVGARSRVGAGSVLFPNVVVYEDCILGERVRVHANSTIGADGFGYALQREPRPRHHKIYHLGTVEIGDDVEIGANACVDRGTLGPTRIGAGAKLDNQVHVGHNAEVGAGAILCGGTCLAGHARVREFAFVGGLVGVSNQVTVGAGAKVGALSLIAKDVPPGAAWVGNPAREHGHHFKIQAMLNRLLKQKKKGGEG